jgi:hypothetical protein
VVKSYKVTHMINKSRCSHYCAPAALKSNAKTCILIPYRQYVSNPFTRVESALQMRYHNKGYTYSLAYCSPSPIIWLTK